MSITRAQRRGERGEQLARDYLEARGYRFVTANWSCKLGEIDLIMDAPDGTRVFVEVRTRSVTNYGGGAETVAREKQQKLIRAARLYQQREQYWGLARFDVVGIEVREGEGPKIEHISHAFET